MTSGVFSSLIWKFLNGGTVQVIQLVVSIVVARMLAPADFGVVALLLVFTSISTVFIQAGLGTAIVQKKEISQTELSSVFYYSFFSAILLYVILYVIAPFIGHFYLIDGFSTYMRVLALILIPGSFNAIQNALVAKKMLWKQQCICNIVSVSLSGTIGIVFACYKMGPWTIIYQQLSYSILVCICLFFIVRWKPSSEFSLKKSKPLFKYGLNLLGANLVDTIFHNFENLIIAKKFAPETLAFFQKGKMFPYLLMTNIDGSLQSVMLPVFSNKQGQLNDLKSLLHKSVSASTFVLFGVLTILFLCAEPMIIILLGEQWIETIPFIQMYCVIGLLIPIETTFSQAINAIGKAGIFLKIMSIKRCIGVLFLLMATIMFENVFAIVVAALIVEILAVIMHMYYNYKILNYTLLDFFRDIYRNVIACVMVMLLYFVYQVILPQNPYIELLIIGFLSITIYICVLYILKSEELKYLLNKVLLRSRKFY